MKIFNLNVDTEAIKVKIQYRWILFTNFFRGRNGVISIFSTILVLGGLVTGVIYIREQQGNAVHAGGVDLKLVTANSNLSKDSEFNVDVYIDTAGLSVAGSDIKIKYDSNLLLAESITQSTFLPVVFVPGQIVPGTASIVLGCDPTAPKNGTGILATIKFKALGQGTTTSISFDPATEISAIGQVTNVLGSSTSLDVNILPLATISPSESPVSTPYVTPSEAPSPTPNLVPSESPAQTPSVTPSETPSETPSATATSAPSNSPSSSPASGVIAGDINGDGRVSVIDLGILIDNYGKSPLINPKADINGDGRVSVIDLGILIDNYGK